MRSRVAIWIVLFFALAAGAWFALRPPELPQHAASGATPAAPSMTEARAAAVPTSSKLGTSAVLSIDPRSAGAAGGPSSSVRQGLWTEYLGTKSYKALFDRLSGGTEGETPEARYVVYDILRKCATVTERT